MRLGIVTAIDRKKARVRVRFEDQDDTTSHELSVMQNNTFRTKSYWLPVVDEQVICLFLNNGQETGIVIGSLYSEQDKPVPEIADEGKHRDGIWFEDGTYVKYESDTQTLVVHAAKDIKITAANNISITATNDVEVYDKRGKIL